MTVYDFDVVSMTAPPPSAEKSRCLIASTPTACVHCGSAAKEHRVITFYAHAGPLVERSWLEKSSAVTIFSASCNEGKKMLCPEYFHLSLLAAVPR